MKRCWQSIFSCERESMENPDPLRFEMKNSSASPHRGEKDDAEAKKNLCKFPPMLFTLSLLHGTAWMMPSFFMQTWKILSGLSHRTEWKCAWIGVVNKERSDVFGALHRLKKHRADLNPLLVWGAISSFYRSTAKISSARNTHPESAEIYAMCDSNETCFFLFPIRMFVSLPFSAFIPASYFSSFTVPRHLNPRPWLTLVYGEK